MTRWHSLYLSSDALDPSIVETHLTSHGFNLYNPFGLMPGRVYAQTLRVFITPSVNGWVRLLVEATEDAAIETLAQDLSVHGDCLSAGLNRSDGTVVTTYRDQQAADPQTVLTSHLRTGKTAQDINLALQGKQPLPAVDDDRTQIGSVTLDDLPDDIQALADRINPKQANKMFNKMSKKLLGGSSDTGDILQTNTPDWNSDDGRIIRAVMTCLTVPENWRTPDFTTLRTAYQLHKRRERRPDAPLYPGDAESMQAVPDALVYQPVYGGQDA